MRLDQREIARYLGAAGKPLWPEAAALGRDCQRELEGTVTPRLLGRRLSLSLFAGESRDLDWHLAPLYPGRFVRGDAGGGDRPPAAPLECPVHGQGGGGPGGVRGVAG